MHRLRMQAMDAVGNVQEMTLDFRVDGRGRGVPRRQAYGFIWLGRAAGLPVAGLTVAKCPVGRGVDRRGNGMGARGAAQTQGSASAGQSRRGETAIGYRLAAEAGNTATSYGVHTNPKKIRNGYVLRSRPHYCTRGRVTLCCKER